MSESTETAPETQPTATAPTAPAGPKPPWGSEADFNPEKAWNLIQNLRTEASEAKAKADTASKEATELAQFRVKAQEAEDSKAETEITLHRERAARTHKLNDEQFEFLSELTDPEAINTRAEKLAAMTKASNEPVPAVDPAQGGPVAPLPLNSDPLLDSLKSKLGIS